MTERLAVWLADVQRIDRVTLAHLAAEGRTWGLARADAEAHILGLLQRVPEAIEQARTQVPSVPAALPTLLQTRLAALERALAAG